MIHKTMHCSNLRKTMENKGSSLVIPIAIAVSCESPVIIFIDTPEAMSVVTASFTPVLGGSIPVGGNAQSENSVVTSFQTIGERELWPALPTSAGILSPSPSFPPACVQVLELSPLLGSQNGRK